MSLNFKSERITRSAEVILIKDIKTVFPLFGAIEEKKWADGWNPEIIFSESGGMEEGMIFKTEGRGFADEKHYTWIVTNYDTITKEVIYTVSTHHRVWFIKIKCTKENDNTKATISYTYTGLTETGNELNKIAMDKMYSNNLKDWEDAINYYLETGSLLKQ